MGKILVTGSSGFIGTQIVKRLHKLEVITDSHNSEHIDLQNRDEVMELESTDLVIHLGGKTPKKELGWEEYFKNNFIGTINVFEYCIKNKIKNMIYVSSYVYENRKYYNID